MFIEKTYEIHNDLWATSKFALCITYEHIGNQLLVKKAFIYDLQYRFEDHYDES